MGNKCCSKRQDQELALSYPGGYKKGENSFTSNMSGPKHSNGGGGSLDSRYTPDPNRGQLIKGIPKGGVDIIRPRTTQCKYHTDNNAMGIWALQFLLPLNCYHHVGHGCGGIVAAWRGTVDKIQS
ncbi:hypothetical protein RP20_CCG008405 [Aedes albopictus]|nr:hypothetical protein RP20_CCG008405 [Aedes albopictus]